MARRSRRYRAPLVITLAASLGPACGDPPGYISSGDGDGDGDGGSSGGAIPGSGGRSGAGGTTLAAGGVLGATGGALGGGGNPPEPELPACPEEGYGAIECEPFTSCTRTLGCTSGRHRKFVFTCSESGTSRTFPEARCDLLYEFCSGPGSLSCGAEGEWIYEGYGGNPPAPCPPEAPALGSTCNPGGSFGADRTNCGYRCASGDWTIIGCQGTISSDQSQGTWEGDGACGLGGAGGQGN